jgi:hypothetical protein
MITLVKNCHGLFKIFKRPGIDNHMNFMVYW